ncbi:hypothetical protein EV182_007075 [Spiromyces aspiralis]|uniref:Uncharacterized protein n=1 Tax=Spiromyces aspiralis TaxID=68401 RepID=A0ACC1HEW4_9FUNG|nr:hypothetical protein EV182_007075 [Spiromyces aspiralis]
MGGALCSRAAPKSKLHSVLVASAASGTTTRSIQSTSHAAERLRCLPRTVAEIKGSTAIGSSVTVHGWVRTVRIHKQVAFVEVSDGSMLKGIQVIADNPELVRR